MNPGLADAKKRAAAQKDQKFAAAGPVNVFAYPGGVCKPMGPNGMAIVEVSKEDRSSWVIFVYTPTQQPICQIVVTETFEFKVLENNYCGFYDMQKQYWTVSCDAQLQYKFARAIGLAKIPRNFLGKNHKFIIQDLNPEPKGQALTANDKCIVKVDIYLPSEYHPKGLGQNIYSEASLKLKLSSGKPVSGVCEGCIGMRIGSQRILVLPPNKAWGAAGNPKLQVPANSSIVVVIEVLKAKFVSAPKQAMPVQQQKAAPVPQQQTTATTAATTSAVVVQQEPANAALPAAMGRQTRTTSLSKIARMAEAAGVRRMILPGMKKTEDTTMTAETGAMVPVESVQQPTSPNQAPSDQQPLIQQQPQQQFVQPQQQQAVQQQTPMVPQQQVQPQMQLPQNMMQMQNAAMQMQINQPRQNIPQQQMTQHQIREMQANQNFHAHGGRGPREGGAGYSDYGGGAMYDQNDAPSFRGGYGRDDRRRFDRRASPSPYSVHSRREYDRDRDFDTGSRMGGTYGSEYSSSTHLLDLTRKVDQMHAKMNEPVLGADVSGIQFMKTFQTFYKEYETNKSNVESLTEQVTTLREKNRTLHEKNHTLIEKNSELMEDKFSLLSNADAKFQDQITKLQQERDDMASKYQGSSAIIAGKDAELVSVRAELASTQVRLTESEKRADTAEKELESLKTESRSGDEIRTSLEAQVAASSKEKEELEKRISDISAEVEEKNKQAAELQTKLDSIQEEITRLRKLEETSKSQTEELASMRSDVAKSRSALSEYKMKSAREIETLKEELDSFRLSGDGGKSSGGADPAELEKLSKQNAELETQIQSLGSQIADLNSSLQETRQALESSQSETQAAVNQGRAFKEKLVGKMKEKESDLIQRIMSFVYFQAQEHLEVDGKKLKGLVKAMQKNIMEDPDGFDDEEDSK